METTAKKSLLEVHGLNGENAYRYAMLNRMKSDCDYYLGNGGRNSKCLWAGNEADHIAIMRELWESLPVKPEWLTREQLEDYARKMHPARLLRQKRMIDIENQAFKITNRIDAQSKTLAEANERCKVISRAYLNAAAQHLNERAKEIGQYRVRAIHSAYACSLEYVSPDFSCSLEISSPFEIEKMLDNPEKVKTALEQL